MTGGGHVDQRFDRIETKLDDLNKAVILLARIEERLVAQSELSQRLGRRQEVMERRISRLELSRAKFAGAVIVLGGLSTYIGPLIEKLFTR